MISDEFDDEGTICLSHRVISKIEVHAHTSRVTGNTGLQIKFRGDDGELACARYPRWLISTDLEQRWCNRTHRQYLISTEPVCVQYTTTRGVVKDCTLTPANISHIDFQKLFSPCGQRVDCVLDISHKPQLVNKPFGIQPIIGGVSNEVIETFATNAMSESDRYLVWLIPAVWDKLAKSVYENYIVTLKGCCEERLEKCKTINIDNYQFYVSQGGLFLNEKVFKSKLSLTSSKGWISYCNSIELRHSVDFARIYPERLILPTYDDLLEYNFREECAWEEARKQDDDYEPKLSDYYDDMEELELNTRGDGFD